MVLKRRPVPLGIGGGYLHPDQCLYLDRCHVRLRHPAEDVYKRQVYQYGLLDLKKRIEGELSALDFMNDPEATDKQEELTAMSLSLIHI